jgi:hypothetical protein
LLQSSLCHFTSTLLHRPFSRPPPTSALVWIFRMLYQKGCKGECLSVNIGSWTGPDKKTLADFDTTTLWLRFHQVCFRYCRGADKSVARPGRKQAT